MKLKLVSIIAGAFIMSGAVNAAEMLSAAEMDSVSAGGWQQKHQPPSSCRPCVKPQTPRPPVTVTVTNTASAKSSADALAVGGITSSTETKTTTFADTLVTQGASSSSSGATSMAKIVTTVTLPK